jgi:ribosomal protein S18 acetylase RimI-like enzyme
MALKEAPYAFGSTYDSALKRSDESWREQVESSALGSDRATFVVFSDNVPIGIAALYRDKENGDTGELLQVWVHPEFRGTSVIWDLMDEIFQWAAENNFREVLAGVTKENTRAIKFYSKYGFTAMDETSQGVVLVKEVV